MLTQTPSRAPRHTTAEAPALALDLAVAQLARAAGDLLPELHGTAASIIGALGRVGYTLLVDGETLRARGPAGALTPELRAAIAEQKPALLALLAQRAHPCARCGRHAFPAPGTVCAWCRRDPTRGPARHDGGATDRVIALHGGERANASADTAIDAAAGGPAAGGASCQ